METDLFDRKTILRSAGEPTFGRGLAYYEKGRVSIKSADAKHIRAVVSGTENYRVELRTGAKALRGTCTCPAREDSDVCKHMVAAALAALDLPAGPKGSFAGKKSLIAGFLETLPRERLIAIITEHAARHSEIESALELAAMTGNQSGEEVLSFFRRALNKAVKVHRFIEYREARGWAKSVEEVLGAMEPLAADGHAQPAMTLAEEALALISEAAMSIDDSDGHCGGLIWKVRELHAAAAGAAKPEPLAFAARLLELVGEIDLFEASEVVDVYGDALGPAGLSELERLALTALDKLPPRPRAAAGYVADKSGADRWSLTRIAEDCARLRDDVEAQLALKRRDLSTPYHYLGIAEFLRRNGRPQEALRWAKDGVFVFEDNPDVRLTLACVDLLDEAGERGEAEQMLWREFASQPSGQIYSALASRSKPRRAMTDRAVALLEERLARPSPSARRDYQIKPLMLEILTDEKRYAEAWSFVARHNIALTSPDVGRLADKSADQNPDEAVKVWRMRIEELAGLGGNGNYVEAHALTLKTAKLASRSGQQSGHAAFVADLLTRHKTKRNFVKLFS